MHPVEGELRIDFIDGQSWDERHAQRKRYIHYVPTHAVQSLLRQDQHQFYQQRYYSIGDEQPQFVKDLLGNHQEIAALRLPVEFSIDHLLNVEVNRLSNGQLKKLLLIKVLLTGLPKVMLLDYPFEGLDKVSRQSLCGFIDYLASAHGMQVILVDQHNEVPTCVNRVLRLDRFRPVLNASYPLAGVNSADEGALSNLDQSASASPAHSEVELRSADSPTAVVEVSDIKIQYGDHVVLKDFSWRVNKGDRWALVGRNGAGKTTLFSMIFADHPMAYSQDVKLFGRRRGTGESIWEIKRRISYLGPEQLSYLSPAHIQGTAHEYLLRALRKWDAEHLSELITAFHAEEFLNLPVRILSSGQLQVILIMQCLLTECELLLLDEPFQFLDPERKETLNHVLNHYLGPDKTLILITHYAADLRQWTSQTKYL